MDDKDNGKPAAALNTKRPGKSITDKSSAGDVAAALDGKIRVLGPVGEDRKRAVIERAYEAGDVLSWRKYDDKAVVVTVDGQKHELAA